MTTTLLRLGSRGSLSQEFGQISSAREELCRVWAETKEQGFEAFLDPLEGIDPLLTSIIKEDPLMFVKNRRIKDLGKEAEENPIPPQVIEQLELVPIKGFPVDLKALFTSVPRLPVNDDPLVELFRRAPPPDWLKEEGFSSPPGYIFGPLLDRRDETDTGSSWFDGYLERPPSYRHKLIAFVSSPDPEALAELGEGFQGISALLKEMDKDELSSSGNGGFLQESCHLRSGSPYFSNPSLVLHDDQGHSALEEPIFAPLQTGLLQLSAPPPPFSTGLLQQVLAATNFVLDSELEWDPALISGTTGDEEATFNALLGSLEKKGKGFTELDALSPHGHLYKQEPRVDRRMSTFAPGLDIPGMMAMLGYRKATDLSTLALELEWNPFSMRKRTVLQETLQATKPAFSVQQVNPPKSLSRESDPPFFREVVPQDNKPPPHFEENHRPAKKPRLQVNHLTSLVMDEYLSLRGVSHQADEPKGPPPPTLKKAQQQKAPDLPRKDTPALNSPGPISDVTSPAAERLPPKAAPEPTIHRLYQNPFAPDDDQAPFLLIGGEKVLQRRKLLEILQKHLSVKFLERDLSAPQQGKQAHAPEDIIVDERTCIVFFPLAQLAGGLGGTGLMETLLDLSLKYETCWIVLEAAAAHDRLASRVARVDYAVLFASVSGFVHLGLTVKLAHSQVMEDTAILIRTIAHLSRLKSQNLEIWSRDQWCSRDWLSRESTHERFLRAFPSINSFSAQILLTGASLRELASLSPEELIHRFRWIPSRCLVQLHAMMNSSLGT